MRRLLRFPRLPGGIVLMHVASNRDEPPWEALPGFFAELEQREIAPVRVTELLASSPSWRGWLQRARTMRPTGGG